MQAERARGMGRPSPLQVPLDALPEPWVTSCAKQGHGAHTFSQSSTTTESVSCKQQELIDSCWYTVASSGVHFVQPSVQDGGYLVKNCKNEA